MQPDNVNRDSAFVNDERWFGNEHPALRRVWHPIADVGELDGPGPHEVRLLGGDYALFRAGEAWSLIPDTCPHRLAPLTAGTLIEHTDGSTVLQCAYHGWCFGETGTCVEIPAIGPGKTVPAGAHLTAAHAVVERYDILWAALDEPATPIPAFPEFDDPAFGLAVMPRQQWKAGAAQMADNFLDVAHFPFTHTATIGDPDDQIVGDYELTRDGWEFSAIHAHQAKSLDGSGAVVERTMTFTCSAPHHVRLRLDYPDMVVVLAFFHQPVDGETTRLFCIEASTELREFPERAQQQIDFQAQVGAEDRELLERIRTKAVPLAPGVEANTRADRITVELRRMLSDLAAIGQ